LIEFADVVYYIGRKNSEPTVDGEWFDLFARCVFYPLTGVGFS